MRGSIVGTRCQKRKRYRQRDVRKGQIFATASSYGCDLLVAVSLLGDP